MTLGLTNIFRPTDHLQIDLRTERRWLDVETPTGLSGRLFTADVTRLKAVYTFNARSWVRLIGQWVETEHDRDRCYAGRPPSGGAVSVSGC